MVLVIQNLFFYLKKTAYNINATLTVLDRIPIYNNIINNIKKIKVNLIPANLPTGLKLNLTLLTIKGEGKVTFKSGAVEKK